MTRAPAPTRTATGPRSSVLSRTIDPSPTKLGGGPAGVDGAFLYHNYLTDLETINCLEEYRQFGIKTVVVTATRFKTTDCATNAYGWWARMPGHLGLILDEAAKRGMECYVGLVESSNVCVAFHTDPNKTQDATETGTTVATLLASYGTKPALKGWYIIDEQALAYEQDPTLLAAEAAYFLALRNAIRVHSALPIMVAPYLGNVDGQSIQTPAQVGTKVKSFIDTSGGDLIVCMQDSVGADAISVGWPRTGGRAYASRQYYDAIRAAGVPATQLWADLEVFNYPTSSFLGSQYRPASIQRIRQQLANAAPCGRRFLWLPTTHMTTANDDAYAGANRLKAAYLALRGIVGALAQPPAYFVLTNQEGTKRDDGHKLTDGWTADPRNVNDAGWVGFDVGGCQVSLFLGDGGKTVHWVAAHVLNDNAAGYRIPTGIQVEHSPDGSAWTNLGTTTNTYGGTDAEGCISNTTAFTVTTPWLRVTLVNASFKTLLSELEIVVD